MKNALFRNLKLWWETCEGLWLPCESFPQRWLARQCRLVCAGQTLAHVTLQLGPTAPWRVKKYTTPWRVKKWGKLATLVAGKKVSFCREGNRLVISRAALNYLGPQQPCPAPSPQEIPRSAAAPGRFWVTSDPSRSAVTIPPIYPQWDRMDLNKVDPLLQEGKQVCTGLLGTAMASGKEDRALPMGSFGCTNCMQNYLDVSHSKVAFWFF